MKCANSDRFHSLCSRVGVPATAAGAAWEFLATHYRAEGRFYHNLAHVDKMLASLDAVAGENDAMELAIWFHDVIYDPLAQDNEAQSVVSFKCYCAEFLELEAVLDVERYIMATDPRRECEVHDERLIGDIDLAVLGAPALEYQQYSRAIRKEYSMYPDDQFHAGRSAVLKKFLAGRIYSTKHFSHLETQARKNLQSELERLS